MEENEKKNKLFDTTLSNIKQNRKNLIEHNKPNCIPFEWFPKLRTVLPGIVKGTNWMITAGTGIGKTQFTKHNFVYKPIEWVKNNPHSKIKYKILYFAIEESKNEFMLTMISNRLYEEYKITISVLELQSMYEDALPQDVINKIESCKDYFSDLDDYLEIVDTITNPTGIYKYVRNYSMENGTHYFYNFKTDKAKTNCKPANNKQEYEMYSKSPQYKDWAYSHYIPDNPDEYVAVIVDHFSLLEPESGAETLHKAMSRMSADYGRKMITKHFNYVFVDVQQQAADGEKAEFTKTGTKIEEKFKPSLANLADNKLTARDCHVVIGIFAPVRHNIKKYMGYDTGILRDKFRSAIVLKNRIGSGYIEDAMYFNGASCRFRELPYPEEMGQNTYKQIVND